MRPITEQHEQVRQLMADFLPRTPQDVAQALGIEPRRASVLLSEIKRYEYSIIIVETPGVPGQGNGRAPCVWQRRMFRRASDLAA